MEINNTMKNNNPDVDTSDEKWAKFDRWDRECNQRIHRSKDEREYIDMFKGMVLMIVFIFFIACLIDCFLKAT